MTLLVMHVRSKDELAIRAIKRRPFRQADLDRTMLAKLPTRAAESSRQMCRICFEAGEMVAPCACKGSQKWVHHECLALWETQKPPQDLGVCGVCKSRYTRVLQEILVLIKFLRDIPEARAHFEAAIGALATNNQKYAVRGFTVCSIF
eukprot:gnl/TRDRNA2_/TRDRNA2_149242_c2_seq1.p1 gnl/TRDRNA2_/TRDRNA2_149242_c2~~gnl/TRDRNA2_/TRDRNA2_149242_c2_seq1.p1  ORF type:complete len:148 (+),score=8.19 gnl/TRDRNA2_/TRDRNA2_149242_c2_seq1:1-444(+)